MAELGQRRRTVHVLELLDESFRAHQRGEAFIADAFIDEAQEIDVAAVLVIRGGMIIGEIPDPDRDWPGWAVYVQASRDALAAAEAEAE